MGNLCCSCFYPNLSDDDCQDSFGSIEKKLSLLPNSIDTQVPPLFDSGSFNTSYCLSTSKFGTKRRSTILSSSTNAIYSLYSPSQTSQHNFMYPTLKQCLAMTRSSSIVSLNDHKLFMEVSDMHFAEIKRQLVHSESRRRHSNAMCTSSFELDQCNDSGIGGMSMISNMSCTTTSVNKSTGSMRMSMPHIKLTDYVDADDEIKEDESQDNKQNETVPRPLVYFFETLNFLTRNYVKNASYSASLLIGTNLLYKWTRNSMNKLRSRSIFKFNIKQAYKNIKQENSIKATSKSTSQDVESTLTTYYDSIVYSTHFRLSPLRQFMLRFNDVNFF